MEIVNSYPVPYKIGTEWGLDPDHAWVLGVILGAAFIIGLIWYIRYRFKNDFESSDILLVLLLTGLLACSIACFHAVPIMEETTRYEVKFTDMPYIEVVEKYDILDHRGDLWVIEEKRANN